jgi:nucleoside-diphosphate-sugar epimerase
MSGKPSILIVGGTGFIGAHVVKEAVGRDFFVLVLSKNTPPLSSRIKNVEYISLNVTIKNDLFNHVNKRNIHYVINLGGYINHASYSNGGSGVYDVHFNGVRNLIDCLNKSKIKGFVQIGSSDEYGDNSAPQIETQREMPISPYSCAKVASTHFLQTLYRTEMFPAVILRPFLVYGPGQSEERFIPQIIKGCINNQKFPVSKGEQLRDFCFIDNFVQAIFSALDNNNVHGEVINIASGKSISIKQVINAIVDIIGSGEPQFGQVAYRNGENMALYADIAKAEDLLGWKPSVSLRQGLLETIKWVKN